MRTLLKDRHSAEVFYTRTICSTTKVWSELNDPFGQATTRVILKKAQKYQQKSRCLQ